MRSLVLGYVGVAFLLLGAGITAYGAGSLCVSSYCNTSSASIGTPSFDCSSIACTAHVPVTNNNVTEQIVPYYSVLNSGGQNLFESAGSPVAIPLGQTEVLTSPTWTGHTATRGYISFGNGSYSLRVFLLDYEGFPVSPSQTTTITSATFTFTVITGSSGQVTVSVNGQPVNAAAPCPALATCGPYTEPKDAQVTLQANNLAAGAFTNWQFYAGGKVASTSTANPVTFTLGQDYEVVLNAGCNPADCIGLVASNSAEATVTPALANVYNNTGAGPTSATFTVTQGQVSASTIGAPDWQISCAATGRSTPFTGTVSAGGSTATISFAQAQAAVKSPACGGTAQQLAVFVTYGTGAQLDIIDSTTYPGVVTMSAKDTAGTSPIPAPGISYLPAGDVVTITASGLKSGYYLNGWTVQQSGQIKTLAVGQKSVSVTMGAAGTSIGVNPVVLPNPTTPPPPGGGGSNSSTCSTGNLSPSGDAGLDVTVVDAKNGSAVAGAAAQTRGVSGTTDASGHVLLNDLTVPNSLGSNKGNATVTVTKAGYTTQKSVVLLVQSTCSSVVIPIVPSGPSFGGNWTLPGLGVAAVGMVVATVGFTGRRHT